MTGTYQVWPQQDAMLIADDNIFIRHTLDVVQILPTTQNKLKLYSKNDNRKYLHKETSRKLGCPTPIFLKF